MSSQARRPGEDPDRPLDRRTTARTPGERPADIDDLSEERAPIETPEPRVREPGTGPGDPIRFDENPAVPPRETESAAPGPALATGMFLPVIILAIVAIVLIVIFVI